VPVCGECLDGLSALQTQSVCLRCGLPFENRFPLDTAGICGLCRRGATLFDWGRGYGAYEGPLRQMIHLLKYDGMQPLATPLGSRLFSLLQQAGPVDLIVPVPLDRHRLRSRGFNQSELLAKQLSKASGIRMDTSLLRRLRRTETQTGLSHAQRRLNVRGAFVLSRPNSLVGLRIALIDDVITTGATANACAALLKSGGAERVAVIALARARRRIVGIEDAAVPLAAVRISGGVECQV